MRHILNSAILTPHGPAGLDDRFALLAPEDLVSELHANKSFRDDSLAKIHQSPTHLIKYANILGQLYHFLPSPKVSAAVEASMCARIDQHIEQYKSDDRSSRQAARSGLDAVMHEARYRSMTDVLGHMLTKLTPFLADTRVDVIVEEIPRASNRFNPRTVTATIADQAQARISQIENLCTRIEGGPYAPRQSLCVVKTPGPEA